MFIPFSEIPEPHIVVMMLIGVILVGVRASRVLSREKFEPPDVS
ncbi:hypothetical protein [Zemynaea arenosa]|nr:hypothetical protein [Massilia arenosa]